MNYGDIFTAKDFTRYSIWAAAHNAVIEDLGNGSYKIVESDNPKVPNHEEIETARANMYQMLVDPITCHIQRLSDEEQTAEIMTKVAELRAERSALMADISLWLPYPVEETNNSDGVLSEAPENKGQSESETEEAIEDGLQR